MMLGFKDQFVPYVEDGSKRHTIRSGERWKAGMRADLYARPRQKGMRLLFRAIVTRVEPIYIGTLPYAPDGEIDIVIQGQRLSQNERDSFAWRDGFRWRPEPCAHCCNWAACNALQVCRQIGSAKDSGCFKRMMDFWDGQLPFTGQIIHWDYERRFMEAPKKRHHVMSGPRGPIGADWSAAHVE